MTADPLQKQLTHLAEFLITSARALPEEPPDYGVTRLMDAAGWLLDIMVSAGMDSALVLELERQVDAARFGKLSKEEMKTALDALIIQFSNEEKRLNNG
jgi:hypothetical protein